MKKWFTKFLVLFIVLLSGYGNVYTHFGRFTDRKLDSIVFIKRNSDTEKSLDKSHLFETFKRKVCFLDNEETQESFSTIQKQRLKSNYFLSFFGSNKFAVFSNVFTKKTPPYKFFNLLSNKVYLLFQVFRI